MADAALGAERQAVTRTSRYRLDRQFSTPQETIAMSAIYAANHYDKRARHSVFDGERQHAAADVATQFRLAYFWP